MKNDYVSWSELCHQARQSEDPRKSAEAKKYEVKQGVYDLRRAIEDKRKLAEKLERSGNYTEAQKWKGIIARAEEKGMIDGSFEISYEGAEKIYSNIRQITEGVATRTGHDYMKMLEALDPVKNPDLFATGLFCLVPEVRDYVRSNDALYKIMLTATSKKRSGYALPLSYRRNNSDQPLFEGVRDAYLAIPSARDDSEAESQEKFKVLLDKMAERESFVLLRKNPTQAIERLKQLSDNEQNPNLKEAYQKLLGTYNSYLQLETPEVNHNFRDPTTGQKDVLPSIHQRSALYHLVNEKKLGIFDGCGTGKTAVSVLAKPIIEQRIGSPVKTLIACPNTAKKAWKKGLVGNDEQRYLKNSQKVVVINGERKTPELMREIEHSDWVIVNYEQLITSADKEDKLFVDQLEKMGFNYVIFDEAHHIKSQRKTTKKGRPTLSAAAQRMAHNADYLAVLTASPIANSLDDYGVIANLLHPERFPDPRSLREAIGQSPRELYTFFHQKTIRRTAEDINDELDWDENEVTVDLTPEQRKLYDHIVEFRPSNWLDQAKKAILDPRLVDPEILQKVGLLGKITPRSSSKYRKLEEILTSDDGPVARGDKFIVFTQLREGVTEEGHQGLKRKYQQLGKPELYDSLQLEENLSTTISNALKRKFGKSLEVAVIDGSIPNIEEREKIVDKLSDGLTGIVCTTDSGGESLDFTPANYVAFLEDDYTPKTTEQALSRVLRKGQKKKVDIAHFRATGTLDEDLKDYVERKKIIIKTAVDGHPLLPEELEILEDTQGKKLGELIKRGFGGSSINTTSAPICDIYDFKVARRVSSKSGLRENYAEENTTQAQKLMQWIGRDPNCWKDPEFVKFYLETLPTLSVPVMHRARVVDLIQRTKKGQIEFPQEVLADASGPSILYGAYQELSPLIVSSGLVVPKITDRDYSPAMLRQGSNPNKVLGNMNGEDSPFSEKIFDMVDNGSIKLCPNPDEVKKTLLESHRVLKDQGLLELVVKNSKFSDSFYSGIGKLGFELLSEKNQGFAVTNQMKKRLKEQFGERFAEVYSNKLSGTNMILARKVDNPTDVNAEDLWFEKTIGEENSHIPEGKKKQDKRMHEREVRTPERISGGIIYTVGRDGLVKDVRKAEEEK
ncbi:MAG: SNF2-related protein [Nanoarchaeota archaeon]|nr:SNF2-related protein [Nanoarchaeota archaeon]